MRVSQGRVHKPYHHIIPGFEARLEVSPGMWKAWGWGRGYRVGVMIKRCICAARWFGVCGLRLLLAVGVLRKMEI